jgi:hypothetical protein
MHELRSRGRAGDDVQDGAQLGQDFAHQAKQLGELMKVYAHAETIGMLLEEL